MQAEADWRTHLIDSDVGLRDLLARTQRVAVLGIKTERQADQPAFYVPSYLVQAGLELVPVPVYYPEVQSILGQPVRRRLSEIEGPVDLLDVFRRPVDLLGHLDEILRLRPHAVWLQQGIRHEGFAEALARAGILVVQDRCLMVEHRRLAALHRN